MPGTARAVWGETQVEANGPAPLSRAIVPGPTANLVLSEASGTADETRWQTKNAELLEMGADTMYRRPVRTVPAILASALSIRLRPVFTTFHPKLPPRSREVARSSSSPGACTRLVAVAVRRSGCCSAAPARGAWPICARVAKPISSASQRTARPVLHPRQCGAPHPRLGPFALPDVETGGNDDSAAPQGPDCRPGRKDHDADQRRPEHL